jgi:hypothetical protein
MGGDGERDDEPELEPRAGADPGPTLVADLLSYAMGCIVGRWDVRIALHVLALPALPDLFAPLPAYSPAMLGPSALTELHGYPIDVAPHGIVPDDSDHPEDITNAIRTVLATVIPEGDLDNRDVSSVLGVESLAHYLHNPKHFWGHHVSEKCYSRSRRKAPIYWLLQSPKDSYGLWLYYHRLNADTLSKALVLYVEPKIRLEEGRLEELHAQRSSADPSGKEERAVDKATERQEAVLSDLYDFRDRLKRAADLNLVPDLDDGVVLNIAPLWELVPWKEPKLYWDELMAGKYAWSSIGKQLREKGLVAE